MKYATQGVEDIGQSDSVHHPGGLTVLMGVTVTVCVFLEDKSSILQSTAPWGGLCPKPGVGCARGVL